MAFTIIVCAFVITFITERISISKVEKYEFKEEKREVRLGKREYRGLIFAIAAGTIYLLIFIYNIIPGLPFSGKLLDYSQNYYIDKLFSYDSFFSNGFVFIVTMFFVILGLFYGIGAKTIKNNNDFCENLTHSLDGTGRTLILILLASVLVNVFKKSNIALFLTTVLLSCDSSIFMNQFLEISTGNSLMANSYRKKLAKEMVVNLLILITDFPGKYSQHFKSSFQIVHYFLL